MQKESRHFDRCISILNRSPLFEKLDTALLENMLKLFQFESHLKGETAVSPQQASDRFYIIMTGQAKVSVYNPDNGREHILYLLESGDSFDLISLLDGEWQEAVATALTDVEVLSTTVQQARTWIEQHPEFNRNFLPYLGKQMHDLANQATELSLYDTEVRLSRLILRNLVEDKTPNEIRLINNLSQETIASMIGSVRVVIARHLQNWKHKKIISGKRGSWSILDLQALLNKTKK